MRQTQKLPIFFQYTKRNKLFEKLDWEVRFFVEENLIFRRGYAKISTYDLGLYFFTEGRTDKEVVFLYNFRSPPLPPFFFVLRKEKNKIYHNIIKSGFRFKMALELGLYLS